VTTMPTDDALDRRIRRFLEIRADELAQQAVPLAAVGDVLVHPAHRSWTQVGRRELLVAGLLLLAVVVAAVAIGGAMPRPAPYLGGLPLDAAWSPDGRQVAVISYASVGGVPSHVVDVLAVDGSSRRRVDVVPLGGTAPDLPTGLKWSPDGRYLAYVMAGDPAEEAIAIASVDDRNSRPVRVPGWPIAWSPSADDLLILRPVGGGSDVHVIDAGSSEDRALTSDGRSGGGIWSPDGSKILYVDGVTAGTQQADSATWVMNADGSAKRRVGACCDAGWSPDGTAVFTDDDGQQLTRVPLDASGASEPFVSLDAVTGWLLAPDGRSIAVSTDQGIEVRAPGTTARVLTSDRHDRLAAWSPDGRSLAFLGSRPEGLGLFTVSIDGGSPMLVAPSSSTLGEPWQPTAGGRQRLLVRLDGDLVSVAPDGSGRQVIAHSGLPESASSGDRIVIGPDGPDHTVYHIQGGPRFAVTIENTTSQRWVVAFPAIDLFQSGCLPATSEVFELAAWVQPTPAPVMPPAAPPDACVIQPHQTIHVDQPFTWTEPAQLRVGRSDDRGLLVPPVYVVIVEPTNADASPSGS